MNGIVFFLLFGAFCLLLGLHRKDFVSLLKFVPKTSLKRKIAKANTMNQGFVTTQLSEITQILAIYNIPGGIWLVYACSAGLAVAGFGLSNFAKNLFMAPILMVSFAAMPFAIIKFYWLYKEKQMNRTLESALNSITSSYLRSNGSIISAVEENIAQLPAPINQVFQHFLLQITYVDANVADALEMMKLTIHNNIFHQWIDVLIQSESNHQMKKNLSKILDKFSDARDVEAEINTILQDAKRSYLLMLGLSCIAPFLFYFANKEWWSILTESISGKLLLAVYLLGIFLSVLIAYIAHQQSIVQGE